MANLGDRRDISYPERRSSNTNSRVRRPFWLPASNYYVLSVAITAAFFFLMWGILNDSGEATPWVTAGISASILLCGAVFFREIILRRARNRFLREQRRMYDRGFTGYANTGDTPRQNKLTIEKNVAILSDIKQKSEAASVLNKLSAGHREVFELCGEYLTLNESELKTISASSPRFEPLLRGRAKAAKYHRFHMLRWAEIESRALTGEANTRVNTDEKVEAAQHALAVIESALGSYPAEPTLLESHDLVTEMIVSIKVAYWVEEAERAAFKGDYAAAKSLYRDALFYLARDNVYTEEREQAAVLITAEIDKIRTLEVDE